MIESEQNMKDISFEKLYAHKIATGGKEDATFLQNIIEFDELYNSHIDQHGIDDQELFQHYTYSINEICNEKFVKKPCQIVGFISFATKPSPVKLNTPNEVEVRKTKFEISILDYKEQTLDVLPLYHDIYWKMLSPFIGKKIPLLFKGCIVSNINESKYYFYLKSVSEKVTPLNLIYANDYSKSELKEKVEYYNSLEGGIRQYIKDELVKNIGIKGLESANQLDKAIDFMILQSFSRGLNLGEKFSNKLHSLIIGPPASGKKILTKIAKILNPVAYEISSTGSKVTQAGLIGSTQVKASGTFSKPGYLPLASHGIVCIQDFHSVIESNSDIFGTFSKVMEDGEVIDSTSAKTTHTAITSIHLDMNRLSQLSGKAGSTFQELNIPMQIISRLDFIMDIPSDFERQSEIALDMIGDNTLLGTSHFKGHLPEWQQKLKRIVAFISTEYNMAIMPVDVSKEIKKRLTLFLEANLNNSDQLDNTSSMLTRLIVSIQKFAKAIACSKLKREVTLEDVEEAFSFIEYKLEFIASIDPIQLPGKDEKNILKKVEIRKQVIQTILNSVPMSAREICEAYNNVSREQVTVRTVERDLDVLLEEQKAIKIGKGKWCHSDTDKPTIVQ